MRTQALVGEAKSKIVSMAVEVECRIIRAPVTGKILRCNLHEGENAVSGNALPE